MWWYDWLWVSLNTGLSFNISKGLVRKGNQHIFVLKRHRDKFGLQVRQPCYLKVLSKPLCFLNSLVWRVHRICEEISYPCKALKDCKNVFLRQIVLDNDELMPSQHTDFTTRGRNEQVSTLNFLELVTLSVSDRKRSKMMPHRQNSFLFCPMGLQVTAYFFESVWITCWRGSWVSSRASSPPPPPLKTPLNLQGKEDLTKNWTGGKPQSFGSFFCTVVLCFWKESILDKCTSIFCSFLLQSISYLSTHPSQSLCLLKFSSVAVCDTSQRPLQQRQLCLQYPLPGNLGSTRVYWVPWGSKADGS